MATELWLVRHGQAAFGTHDYDRLTDLGWEQARWLGQHLTEMGHSFDRVAAGTLRRQQETATALTESLGGEVETVHGLEEYSADDLMRNAGFPENGRKSSRREHFQRLRGILLDWAAGKAQGAETWEDFNERVRAAILTLTQGSPDRVIAASSGGAIALVLMQILNLGPDKMIEFNLQARNTGVTRLVFSRRTVYVNMVNAIPHLERPDRIKAETYS